jgi:hypothetical protein
MAEKMTIQTQGLQQNIARARFVSLTNWTKRQSNLKAEDRDNGIPRLRPTLTYL